MSINGITSLNQCTAAQTVKTQIMSQAKTDVIAAAKSVDTVKSDTQTGKPTAFGDITGRIANIPNLAQYEGLIQRFISGESEMESAGKPLTDDQIALRGLMREYQRTDTRTLSQIQGNMQLASKNFFNYWVSSGNTGPMPGRLLSADGSFKIFNSKAEKDEYMNNQKMDFLKNVMSVISAGKNSGLDVKV